MQHERNNHYSSVVSTATCHPLTMSNSAWYYVKNNNYAFTVSWELPSTPPPEAQGTIKHMLMAFCLSPKQLIFPALVRMFPAPAPVNKAGNKQAWRNQGKKSQGWFISEVLDTDESQEITGDNNQIMRQSQNGVLSAGENFGFERNFHKAAVRKQLCWSLL